MLPRVLLTTDVVGGVWDFCLALARRLDALEYPRVTLLALGEPTSAQAREAGEAGVRLVVEPLKLEWMQDAHADVRRTRHVVARLVRDLRPDILHANQFAAACAHVEVPVVLTLHSDVLSWHHWTLGVSRTPPDWIPYERLVCEALLRADRVIAVSDFLAGDVGTRYSCRRDIDVIHNGWPSDGPPLPTGMRPRTTLIGGRVWDVAKNIALVAPAARGWDAGRVFLAGEEASPDSGGRVQVMPPLEMLGFLTRRQLEVAMRGARVYLSPARYDPFGLLPLQAALNGCSLLLSDIPSYRELWDGAATFFRSDDAHSLRQEWSRLLNEPDVAADFASRARRRAVERYTLERMSDAYSGVYRRLSGVPAVGVAV